MSRAVTRASVWCALGLAILCVAGAPLWAQQEPRPAKAPPAFRRIYVPLDKIGEQPWQGDYLPLAREEFERLLKITQADATGAPGARAASIERAEYRVKLVGEDLLVGSGMLELARRESTPALLELSPLSLAVSEANWRDEKTKPAVVGAGADARLRVLVEGEKLELAWSQRGERTASGAVSFRLQVPATPITRLLVETPPGVELVVDRGLVHKVAGAPGQPSQWQVDLGGQSQLNLRVANDESRERRPLTLLRQALTYEFSSRGVTVLAQLKLDVHGEPLERLAIDLDPELHLVAARYGELQIPWAAAEATPEGSERIVLQLPEAIVGTGRALQLSAVAPLSTGRAWRLPRLQPQGVAWQEGTAELLIPSPLVLEQLDTEGCRASRITSLSAPASGESVEIQYYRPDAAIEMLLTQPRERLNIDTGTLIDLSAEEITSRVTLQLSLARGQRQSAQFAVQPGWRIEQVENLSAPGGIEWEFDEQAPTTSAMLKVRLNAAIAAGAPARLLISGRRPLPTANVFDAQQLQMLDLASFRAVTRLISVRAGEGLELRWSGPEELQRRDVLKLSTVESQLFAQPPSGLLFAEDHAFTQSALTLQRRKPSYTADVRIDAAVQPDTLTETYTIQCVPEAARVERLLIQFSQARATPVEWHLAGGNSGEFSARRISAGEQAQIGLPPGGEVWELSLQLARPGAFGLRGVRTTPFTDNTPISLASVTDALNQRGSLSIRALGGAGLSIENRRLTPVPAELLDADRLQTARAAFHYQPSRDDLGGEAAISLTPAKPAQASSGAWLWKTQLETRATTQGLQEHWATLLVQTAGRQQVNLTLPEQAQLRELWIDDELAAELPTLEAGKRTILLPPGKSFVAIGVHFLTPGDLPSLAGSQAAPFPELNVPGLSRSWSLWLPPGYDVSATWPAEARPSTADHGMLQRLFGGLARTADSKIFNPLAAADWRAALWGPIESQLGRAASEQFAREIGEIAGDYLEAEELTWGQLLSLAAEEEVQSRRVLLIDRAALAQLEIGPRTPVTLHAAESPLASGLAMLREAQLAVVAHGNVVLLTGAAGVAAHRPQLASISPNVLFTVEPGPLADKLQLAAQPGSTSRFETIDQWRTTFEPEVSPWTLPKHGQFGNQPVGDWSLYTLETSAAATPQVRIVRGSGIRAMAWALFLGVISLGFWHKTDRPALLVAIIAAAACASLMLPAAFAPLATGVFLGGIFCLLVRLIELPARRVAPSDASRSAHDSRRSSRLVTTAVVLLALLQMLQSAAAQPAPSTTVSADAAAPPTTAGATEARETSDSSPPRDAPAEVPAKEPVFRVYVPVDDEQKAADERLLVPGDLIRQLYQRAAAATGQPNGWLISRAQYSGALARDATTKRLTLGKLIARYDLHMFSANAPIHLPLSRAALAGPVIARLDGRPLTVGFSPAGDELILGPLPAERYRLELELQPTLQVDVTNSGFELTIPAISNASLELSLPADAPQLELPSARGQVAQDREQALLRAQLGATNRLAVRWPTGFGMETGAANLEVDELLWVKVRPGATVLDAKFKYRVLSGRVRQVRLLTDPRLRLLTSANSQSPIAAVHTIPGDPQRIDLELSREVSDQVQIELSFLVTGTSSVGNLRLPRLESTGARATRRWLGVSVDAALQPKIQFGEDSKTLDLAEFIAAWNSTDARPQAAYVIPRGEPVWVLATQPNEPHVAAQQNQFVSFGRGSMRVQLEADLTISGGVVVQLGVQGIPGLQVDAISLLEENVQRVARWSIDDAGRITIFLTAPIDGAQRLSLRGRCSTGEANPIETPRLKLLDAEIHQDHLHLFRQANVLAQVEKSAGAVEIESARPAGEENLGSALGSYALADAAASLRATLTPNQPVVRGVAAIALERESQRWMAELIYQVDVTQGVVDSLQFEIPVQWSEPFRITPAGSFKIVPLPGEQRRHLIVSFDKPLQGTHLLSIRGRVALSPGDRWGVPEILPLRVEHLERYVILPPQVDAQPVAWETMGLSRAELPGELLTARPALGSAMAYQVMSERFQATLKAIQRTSDKPRVRLADYHLRHDDSTARMVATFDVDPRGASDCLLLLPADWQLLNVTLDGLPAMIQSQAEDRWRVNFGPRQLTQRLQVISLGPVGNASSWLQFAAPQLAELEVERTLWTVSGPTAQGRPQPRQPASSLGEVDQQRLRLTALAGLMQLPAEALGEHLPEEINRWYRLWRHRYLSERAGFEQSIAATGQPVVRSPEARQVAALDKQVAALDARFSVDSGSRSNLEFDLRREMFADDALASQAAHLQFEGAAPMVELRYPAAAKDSFGARVFGSLCCLALGAVALLGLRRRALPSFAPWYVLGALAVAWWLLLAPSLLGLALLAVALLVWLRVRGQRGTSWSAS